MSNLENLQYPIGKYQPPQILDQAEISRCIDSIERLPNKLREITAKLESADLAKSYRDGGWNIRQIVHHLADSHIHGYVRFKWTLTEDKPQIKTYNQTAHAETVESLTAPIELSLDLIETLHKKWIYLIGNLNEDDMNRTFYHPERDAFMNLKLWTSIYAWHGDHHLGHIKLALGLPI